MAMFQKASGSSESGQVAETVIGPSVKIEGDLKGVGNVIVEGFLNGSLSTDKDVTVGSKAEIKANITAQNATIAGTINGSVTVNEHLSIKSGAVINGDIKTKSISVESGARLNGMISMGSSAGAPTQAKQA